MLPARLAGAVSCSGAGGLPEVVVAPGGRFQQYKFPFEELPPAAACTVRRPLAVNQNRLVRESSRSPSRSEQPATEASGPRRALRPAVVRTYADVRPSAATAIGGFVQSFSRSICGQDVELGKRCVSRAIMFAVREPAAVAIFLFPAIISTLMI